jgi:hypothetical protein
MKISFVNLCHLNCFHFILREDDQRWPKKDVVGRQELEIRLGNEHISFEVNLILLGLFINSYSYSM